MYAHFNRGTRIKTETQTGRTKNNRVNREGKKGKKVVAVDQKREVEGGEKDK